MKAALLRAIATLDDDSAMALYNALAAHIENESEHIEDLKGSFDPADVEAATKAERNLQGIGKVVEACELSLYGSECRHMLGSCEDCTPSHERDE